MQITDKERLENIISYSKLSTNAFATSLGLDRSTKIYNILKGRNGISKPIALLIATKYNAIDYNWILTGEGEMLKGNSEPMQTMEPEQEYKKQVDLYPRMLTIIESQQEAIARLSDAAPLSMPGILRNFLQRDAEQLYI